MATQEGGFRWGFRFGWVPRKSALLVLVPLLAAFFALPRAAGVEVKISGYLKFVGGSMGRIPTGSRYLVKLQDTSRMDQAAHVFQTFEGVADPANEGAPLRFELKIDDVSLRAWQLGNLSIAAVVNCGWTPGPGEWIRPGDFLTTTHRGVAYSPGTTEINNFEVEVEQYSRRS